LKLPGFSLFILLFFRAAAGFLHIRSVLVHDGMTVVFVPEQPRLDDNHLALK
jgi:hypothetical protein